MDTYQFHNSMSSNQHTFQEWCDLYFQQTFHLCPDQSWVWVVCCMNRIKFGCTYSMDPQIEKSFQDCSCPHPDVNIWMKGRAQKKVPSQHTIYRERTHHHRRSPLRSIHTRQRQDQKRRLRSRRSFQPYQKDSFRPRTVSRRYFRHHPH